MSVSTVKDLLVRTEDVGFFFFQSVLMLWRPSVYTQCEEATVTVWRSLTRMKCSHGAATNTVSWAGVKSMMNCGVYQSKFLAFSDTSNHTGILEQFYVCVDGFVLTKVMSLRIPALLAMSRIPQAWHFPTSVQISGISKAPEILRSPDCIMFEKKITALTKNFFLQFPDLMPVSVLIPSQGRNRHSILKETL